MAPKLHLTQAQVDQIVNALRTTPGDHISRGRGGDGYACRGNEFFSIYVEDFDQTDSPFRDEQAFREHLATLDLNDWASHHYRRWVFEALGVHAANEVTDATALRDALDPTVGAAKVNEVTWRGRVVALHEEGPNTVATFETPSERPVFGRWPTSPEVGASLVGRTVRIRGRLVADAPSASQWTIECVSYVAVKAE